MLLSWCRKLPSPIKGPVPTVFPLFWQGVNVVLPSKQKRENISLTYEQIRTFKLNVMPHDSCFTEEESGCWFLTVSWVPGSCQSSSHGSIKCHRSFIHFPQTMSIQWDYIHVRSCFMFLSLSRLHSPPSLCKGRTLYSVVRDAKVVLDVNKTRQIAQEMVKVKRLTSDSPEHFCSV